MSTVPLGLPGIRANQFDRPDDSRLVDTFGRVATDLRVSVTDRCNLRCTYCMPADGLDWLGEGATLTTAEFQRLICIAVELLGVREVRFTGGEPLLRSDLAEIIAHAAALSPRPQLSITTNGLSLKRVAAQLAQAGLDRVNVSLDTVDNGVYLAMTRRDRLADVIDGLAAARDAGLRPIKVNAVLLRGVNDDQANELLDFCISGGFELRFIEQMPLDAQRDWHPTEFVNADEILSVLRSRRRLIPLDEERGSAPAQRWRIDDGSATVGVIASVSAPFCASCDRVRLTADGQLRTCLFATEETDLRSPLRRGDSDEEIARTWREAMWTKASGHDIGSDGFQQPARPMSAIGG